MLNRKNLWQISLVITLGLSLLLSPAAMAAPGSISIQSVELTLLTDADSNSYVNKGDTIRVIATVNNTDGAAGSVGTIVTVDLPQYQGLNEVLMTLTTDNSGANDVYQNDYVVFADTNDDWGIDVSADDAESKVVVIVFDDDDNGVNEITASSNAIGDGIVDDTSNGVDTIAPTDQDTVFASDLTKYPDETFEVVLPGDNGTWHLAPAGLTTTAQVLDQAEVSQGGSDTTTQVPDVVGEYRLYVIDDADQVSAQSTAVLTVIDRPGGGGAAMSSVSRSSSNSDRDEVGDKDNDQESTNEEVTESLTSAEKERLRITTAVLSLLRNDNLSYRIKELWVSYALKLLAQLGE